MAQVTRLPLVSAPARAELGRTLPPADDAALREALKYCAPSTYEAAREFRATGRPEHLSAVVLGVIARYVEPERRSRLREGRDDLRLVEDLGLDSLALMEIVIRLEEVLRISVRDEDLRHFRTLGEIRRMIAADAGVVTPATAPPSASCGSHASLPDCPLLPLNPTAQSTKTSAA